MACLLPAAYFDNTVWTFFAISWCISTGIVADLMPAAYFDNTLWTTATATGTFVTVEVEQGTLRGQEKVSKFFSDKKYYSFEGIPYAKPPEGQLRFKDPEEPEPWSGVRDAIRMEQQPMSESEKQEFRGTVLDQFVQPPKPTDDILYLDVDTPQMGESGKPVIVWIHPMRFIEESAYGPQYFGVGHYMVQDVVMVTVRYRHNALGFLCLDHVEVPGNAGLKDQVMALKWVQRNIAKFGGDPNNITLYGFGVAASFAHYHLMSPLSKGLFHRVIIQGDCALNPHSLNRRKSAIKNTFKLGKELGWDTENTDDLLEFLRAVPVAELVEAAKKVLDPVLALSHFTTAFLPCVEDPATDKSFLPLLPWELLNQGRFAKVPIIMGVSSKPDLLENFQNVAKLPIEDEELSEEKLHEMVEQLAKRLGFSIDIDKIVQDSKVMLNHYRSKKGSSYDKAEANRRLMEDVSYNIRFDEAVREQLEHMEEPLYAFEFNYFGTQNPMKPLMYGDTGRMYGSNHVYDTLVKMWISFAKTGNPNFDGIETTWEPARKESFCYLEISYFLKLVRSRIGEENLDKWKQLDVPAGKCEEL